MKRRYRSHSDITVTSHGMMERLQECNHLRWITPQESWQSNQRRYSRTGHYVYQDNGKSEYVYTEPNPTLPVEYSTSYGDWDELREDSPITPETFVLVDIATGSDYSGTLVEVSNHKVIVDLCDASGFVDGEDYIEYHGGYGTFGIAIRVASLGQADESGFIASLVDTIEGLEDYPLADESLHSELEMESQNEAWESWGRGEFKTELGKYIGAVIDEGSGETETELAAMFLHLACTEDLAECARDDDWITDDNANRWFWELSEYANEYWVNESGSDSYIDMEDVIRKGITRKLTHWEDGERKRTMLYREIQGTLEREYGAWWWGNLAWGMERGKGKG